MFFRLTVKRQDFNFEEFFAAKTPPTWRQLIKYYSNADRMFGEMQDMATVVLYILKDSRFEVPNLKKNNVSGPGYDAKDRKYAVLLQRIDLSPLSTEGKEE